METSEQQVNNVRATKSRSFLTWCWLCLFLLSFVVFLAFSFSGLVKQLWDPHIQSMLRPPGSRKQIAEIEHGWPLVFIYRDCEFTDGQLLPDDPGKTPPWMTWQLWDISNKNSKFSFQLFPLVVDLLVGFLFALVFSLPIVFVGKLVARSQISIRFLCSVAFCIAVVAYFVSSLLLECRRVERYETKCVSIGGKLFNPRGNDFYARIWGRSNIPSQLKYRPFVVARDVTNDDFQELLENEAFWVTDLCAPVELRINDEFVELVSKNYHLPSLTLTLDSPEIETRNLGQLKELKSIQVFGGSVGTRQKIRNWFPGKFSFYGHPE